MNNENDETMPQGIPADIRPPLSPAEVRRTEGMRNSPNPMLGSVRAEDLGNALPGAELIGVDMARGPDIHADRKWSPEELAVLTAHARNIARDVGSFFPNLIVSSVVRANINALVERERAGRVEHGADMDRQDYTARQWLEELIAESLDSANYGRKLLEMLPRLEAAENMLVLLGAEYLNGAWELPLAGLGMDVFTDVPLSENPGIAGIIAERARQISVEGFTREHDDCHRGGALALAASCYARNAGLSDFQRDCLKTARITPPNWPWAAAWWKPRDRRTDLIRAGALLVAELERLDRADAKAAAGGAA